MRLVLVVAVALALGAPAALAEDARPDLSVDAARLPPLQETMSKADRDRRALIAAGTGAVVGIVVADIFTGGLLLAPLGLPGTNSLFGGAAAAAGPAPSYTIVQQVAAGLAVLASALGGGYIAVQVAAPPSIPGR